MTEALNIHEFHGKPTASFVTVTPETARAWLNLNRKNRNLRKRDLDRYRRDMQAGQWRLAGDPIRFATDGTLIDGQHRLTALIQAGVTLPLLVVRGINPVAQTVMDTGRKRTASDALTINGASNGSLLAATALLKISFDMDSLEGKYEASHEEIITTVDAYPGLVTAAEFARTIARRTDIAPATVSFSYFMMARVSPVDAANFWIAAADKVGLAPGDPTIALTNRFAEARRNRERLTKRIQLSLIFRAWNARRSGKSMRFIRVNSPAGGLVPIPTLK